MLVAVESCSGHLRALLKQSRVTPPLLTSGKREEIHAASGQPQNPRRGEGFHVHKAHLCHLQHRAEVSAPGAPRRLAVKTEGLLQQVSDVHGALAVYSSALRPQASGARRKAGKCPGCTRVCSGETSGRSSEEGGGSRRGSSGEGAGPGSGPHGRRLVAGGGGAHGESRSGNPGPGCSTGPVRSLWGWTQPGPRTQRRKQWILVEPNG